MDDSSKLILMADDKELDENRDTGVIDKVEVQEPSFYKVILLNDDFTPMDFVTHVLQKFFNKKPEEAQKIMLDVHKTGQGVAGVFSFEVAETKVFLTNNLAKQNKYPLKCTMEKD
jgi:ATP-dependent Clp protease adaptor protein ClpS